MARRLMILLVAVAASASHAAHDLFVASDIGLLYRVRDLQRGNFSVGAPGGALVTETNVSGGMFGLTSLATTEMSLAGGGQVVVGTSNGLVIPYDSGLGGQTDDPWDVSGDVDDPIQALAVGGMGSMPVAVAAAHSLRNVPGAGVGSTFLVGDSNLDFVKNGSMTALSDPDITSLNFAELHSGLAGNELLVTTTNLTTLAKDSGFIGSFTVSDTDTNNAPTALDHAWDADGDISSIQNPWQFPNNTIAGAVVGDYFTTNSVDEFTILGSTNGGTPSGSGFGKGIQSYQPEPFAFPQFPGFLWENGLGFPDQTVDPVITGAADELLDGEIDGQFWTGAEVVVAGNQQIRIVNSNFVSGRPAINTNQDITSLVLADVLNDDGIPEIVVGTSNSSPSTNALLLVYERDPNDPTSDFMLDTDNFTRGAIFDFGNDKSIVDLGSLLATATPVVDCDFDDDTDCDVDDIDMLGAEIIAGTDNAAFDLTGDGMVDLADRDAWLDEGAMANGFNEPYKLGDANVDGVVDGQDFVEWNNSKFAPPGVTTPWSDGDWNLDNVVDGQDFILWNDNKFTSISDGIGAVPEPSGLVLLMVGMAVGLTRGGCDRIIE